MNGEHILYAGQRVLQILALILAIFDLVRALPADSFFIAFLQEAGWVVGP